MWQALVEVAPWAVGTAFMGLLFFAITRWVVNTLVVGLRQRVDYLETQLLESEKRIRVLENYIHDLGHPVPNGGE